MLPAQHDLHSAEIGDFGGRSGQHEGGCTAHAHAVGQPLDQQRDCAAAAHVDRHADGCSHQDAESIVLSEQAAHEFGRHMNLVQCREQDTQSEHGTGGPDVAENVFEKPQKQVGIRITAPALMKTGEVKEALVLSAVVMTNATIKNL